VSIDREVEDRYARLWAVSAAEFERGTCPADPFLAGVLPDHRAGITLLARLPPAVLAAVRPTLAVLAQSFPEQYVMPESDLHVTVLSIEPAREWFEAPPGLVQSIVEAVDIEMREALTFEVAFRGLSAGGSTAFICGFPLDRSLNHFRERVRQNCFARSVGLNVDARYKLIGAHFSVLRFVHPHISSDQLRVLEELRSAHFGQAVLSRLELVLSDWYMRAKSVVLYRGWELERAALPARDSG